MYGLNSTPPNAVVTPGGATYTWNPSMAYPMEGIYQLQGQAFNNISTVGWLRTFVLSTQLILFYCI